MTAIKKLIDGNGNQFFPITHTKAVVDDNGYTAESRLAAMQDEINQAQMAIGAVPSDLAPTKNSSNWVTSGGIYNFQPVTMKMQVVDLSGITRSDFNLAANKVWGNGKHMVIPCEEGDVFVLNILAADTDGGWRGWLSSYTVPSSGDTTYYATGCNRVWHTTNNELTLTAPAGAQYLCLGTVDGDGHKCTWYVQKQVAVPYLDLIDEKADMTEVMDAVEEKYFRTEYDDVWISSNSNAISAVKSDGNVVVSINSTIVARVGFSVESLPIGAELYLDYTPSGADGKAHWGWTNVISGTYHALYDKDGGSQSNSIGSFRWVKTDLAQKYLIFAAASYSSGQVLTLNGFKVYNILKPSSGDVSSWMPSSYIPIKEGYERYMNIGGTQGSTVYGNYFFQSSDDNINIYDLQGKVLVQTVAMPSFPNTRTHYNTISFGNKYDSSDDFPLLYICSGYTDTTSTSTSHVYAVRFTGTSANYTASLVQTITLDFGRTNGWTEFVVDPIKNRAWINGSGLYTYICVALPDVNTSEVSITKNTAIIDSFNRKGIVLGTSTKSSGQGRFFYHNRVYWVSGIPNGSGEGEDSLFVVVDNTLTHCTEAVVPLSNYGLVDGTSITYEPEGCFIWNDDFYVTYRTFIAKLIQN